MYSLNENRPKRWTFFFEITKLHTARGDGALASMFRPGQEDKTDHLQKALARYSHAIESWHCDGPPFAKLGSL